MDRWIGERVENRAAWFIISTAACDEPRECSFDGAQLYDTLAHVGQLRLRQGADARPITVGRLSQVAQGLGFVEREAEILGALDELDEGHDVPWVLAVAVRAPGGFWQQPLAFIETQGLPVHARLSGHLADPHDGSLNRVPGCNVKAWVCEPDNYQTDWAAGGRLLRA